MTETPDITYDKLLLQERLWLLNAGCFNINYVNRRHGVANYDEQVTSAKLTDGVLAVQVESRTLNIDNVVSFGDYAAHPHLNDTAAFTVFATGPRGGPSPAISFAPREGAAAQTLIAQSRERLDTCWQADRQRQSNTRKQALIGALQEALVGQAPVSVELYEKDEYEGGEHGFKLIYSDGSSVTIALHQLDIESSQLEVNGREVPRYF